ncbi:MAG: hypothetical protein KAI81_02170, partial [Candidatus Marinimicrobia bacterium]|nr:hypothetical protein [Candidatus Neomarinimicrobiota bacterium]
APENVTLMGSYKNNAESQLLDLNLQFVLISPYKLLANVACTVDPRNPDTMADIIIKKIASVLKIEALSADVLNEEIPEINIDKELMGQLDKEMKELQNSMAGLGQRYDSLAIYESGTGKIGSSYYRKLASTDAQIDLEIDNMNRSTLKNAVYEILFNPYVAEIAEPDYIHYPYNPKNMTIILDVAYSLQEELIKDVVELLPFRIYKSRSKNYDYMSFKAKYNDIPFQLRREIQRGDYRVIPVLRFIDKYNKVQHIIVDEKYGELSRPKNAPAPLSVMNQFSQQLTLTASTSSVQLYLKEGQQVCNYRIDMPVSIVENLDRIVVDFIKINEFESWLGKLK